MSSKALSSGSREGSSKGLETPKKKSDLARTPSSDSLLDSDIDSICGSLTQPESDLIRVCIRIRPILAHDHLPPVQASSPSDNAFGSGPHSGHSSHNHSAAVTPTKLTSEDHASVPWVYDDTSIYLPANKDVVYKYDHVFAPTTTNNQIYEVMVKNVVASTMNGYHGAVFSYGQTSSGKTFTMNGNKDQTGVIPLAIQQCFNAINLYPQREFLLRISYLEVYNEQVKDLLTTDVVPIKIQFDAKINATVVTGIKEVVVSSPAQVMALMKTGEQNKHIGFTAMNEKSSRAHTIFRVFIESKDRGPKSMGGSYYSSPVKVSTLNLVDLAGSESAKMTNSRGERAREAKHINQSLLTLSTIIQRLSEHSSSSGKGTPIRKQHLPYRDSKLTRLLESSLDGNAHIAIICTISPTLYCVDETGNTLKFASRAKLIKMQAKINETVDDKTLLRAYREEIEQLKAKLQILETTPPPPNHQISTSGNNDSAASLTHGASMRSLLTPSKSSDNLSGKTAVALAAEKAAAERVEEERIMLQMIAEMEKLILKADLAKISSPVGGASGEGGGGADGAAAAAAGSSGSSLVGTPGSAGLGRSGKKRHHHSHSDSLTSEGVASINVQLFPDAADGGSGPGTNDSGHHSTPSGHHHHHHHHHRSSKKKDVPPLHMGSVTGSDPPPPAYNSLFIEGSATSSGSGGGYVSGNGTFNMALDSPKVIPLNNAKKSFTYDSTPTTPSTPSTTTATAGGVALASTASDDHKRTVKDSSTSPIPMEPQSPVPKNSSGSGSNTGGSAEKEHNRPVRTRSGDLKVDTTQMIQTLNKDIDAINEIIHPTPLQAGHPASSNSYSHSSSSGSLLHTSSSSSGLHQTGGVTNTNPTSPMHQFLKPAPRLIHTVSSVIASYTNNNHISIGSVSKQHHRTPLCSSQSRIIEEGMNESQASVLSEKGVTSEEVNKLTIETDEAVRARDATGRSRTLSEGVPPTSANSHHGGGVHFSLADVVDSPNLSTLKKRMKSYRKSQSKVDLLLKSDSIDEYQKISQESSIRPDSAHHGTTASTSASTATAGVALAKKVTIAANNNHDNDDGVLLPIEGVRVLGDDEYFSGDDEEEDDYSSDGSSSYSDGEEETMILGVTKMLNYLKGYIANRGLATKPSVYHLKGKTLSGFLESGEATEPFGTLAADSSSKSNSNPTLSLVNGSTSNAVPVIDNAQYERLKLDLKLKEADNKFLQEELENKDQMLAMLTEGLKEVEISQHQWLTTNEELSFELEKALQSNMLLKAEIARLKEQLSQAQQQQTQH